MKKIVQFVLDPCALAVILVTLAVGAPTLAPRKWVAAQFVEAQRAVGLRWEAVPEATS